MADTKDWEKMMPSLSSFFTNSITKATIQKIFDAAINLAGDKPLGDKIKKASGWYSSENLVLVLGAGASASYKLPDWNTLLQKLLLITIEQESDNPESLENAWLLASTFAKVFEPNNLIAARYLHNHFKTKNPKATLAFENAIRDALYSTSKDAEESELLKEVRQFCIAPGRSPNLDSIITYNYDDLIERCLKNIDVEVPFKAIHARGMKADSSELPIYHVHGYLPQGGSLTAKNKVILSEEGYHEQYGEVYGWSNLIQINKFKDANCIFIGLSFSDPNLRRLLDISKKERGDDEIHHYCFKRRHEKVAIVRKLEKLIQEDSDILDGREVAADDLGLAAEGLIKLMEKFEENDAASFGVGIIWVESYDEIPGILRRIRTFSS